MAKIEDKRQVSELKFPSYTLADSVGVAKAIHEKGGGSATLDELAAHLEYAGTNNGAFLSRVGAARTFGLITKVDGNFVLTQCAQNILMPHYDWMPKEAFVQAFLSVELFKRVYEEYKGKQLPPEAGMQNAFRTMFKVNPNSVERAYRVLMESAETAGFFEARAGARTHLVMPTISKTGAPASAVPSTSDLPRQGESAPAAVSSNSAAGLEGVKTRYVEALIRLFEEKSKAGEIDEVLMTRIEKILEMPQ